MTAGKINLETGTAPGTPASNIVSFYAKTDKKVYVKDDTGTETLLIGQSTPTAAFDGTSPAIILGSGFASIVRTPAGDPAGDYTITLSAAMTPLPTMLPFASISSGASNPRTIQCELTDSVAPYSHLRVRIQNAAGTAVDAFFNVTMQRI